MLNVMMTCQGVEVYLQNSSPQHRMEMRGQLLAQTTLSPGTESPLPVGKEAWWATGRSRVSCNGEKSVTLAGN
jgi:hypothetical protein